MMMWRVQLFKHTQLRKYPHKEIVVLFMCAYCAYAIGESLYLSGIMALFFCGIILSHYNWYNLSDASKVASAHVFKGFAMVGSGETEVPTRNRLQVVCLYAPLTDHGNYGLLVPGHESVFWHLFHVTAAFADRLPLASSWLRTPTFVR
jgi:hypothetical protein